ncbi:MAG: nucleotide exchange factor GrpE [Candidatus Bathyarchaeia archaeon]|jgi:molecular chaperone GrpE
MAEDKEKQQEPQATDFQKLLESEKKRSEDYLTRLQYMQADFENLKKRFDRETENTRKYCNERIITELLDVVDELELAVKVAKESDGAQKTLVEGVEMTLKKLRKVLEQEGVSPIECKQGTVFDPGCHNAIAAEESDDAKICTVLEEIRRGYKMKEKVLRPSIVRVAQPKSK